MIKYFTIIISIILLSIQPAASQVERMLYSDPEHSIIYFKDANGVDYIRYVGPINSSTTNNLSIAFSIYDTKRLMISSPGGSMNEAYILGQFIRDNNIEVYIPENTRCSSACAYAVLGSYKMSIGGEIAFHLPYIISAPSHWTIENISKSGMAQIKKLHWWLYLQGYTYQLFDIIFNGSTKSTVIVFDDLGNLKIFQNSDHFAVVKEEERYYTIQTIR